MTEATEKICADHRAARLKNIITAQCEAYRARLTPEQWAALIASVEQFIAALLKIWLGGQAADPPAAATEPPKKV